MDRHIVYPGSIPLDTDLLHAIKDAYYGNGWMAESVVGVTTSVVGLSVVPTGPASLQVIVNPGAIFSLQTVDASAYGSLGTDANQFVKMGILAASTTLTITPPGTVGQSINYLVQVQFSETDGSPVVLPYYNASNPTVAWSGPNNTGTAQNTVRADSCVVGLKAGTPAATGSQTTPAPDAGYTGIYVITCAQGQTTITSGNIALLATAPYFPTLPQIPAAVQNNQWIYAVDTGTATALVASISPAPAAYTTGLAFDIKVANTATGAATINLNGLGAKSIVKGGANAVTRGDWTAGDIISLMYDGTNLQIIGGAKSKSSVPTVTTFLSGSGTYNTPATCRALRIKALGGGGGGGGGGSITGNTVGGDGSGTVFGGVTANGGGGGGTTQDAHAGLGGTGGGGSATLRFHGSDGSPGLGTASSAAQGGGTGGSAIYGGAGGGGGGNTLTGNAAAANSGSGGGGGQGIGSNASGAGGGAGELIEIIISSPAASYTYQIGAGGTAGVGGTGGRNGGAGGSGIVVIDEYY